MASSLTSSGHAAFARAEPTVEDELFVLILENTATGEVRGTCQIFTQVGQRFGISKERVRQVRNRALKQLKQTLLGEKRVPSIYL